MRDNVQVGFWVAICSVLFFLFPSHVDSGMLGSPHDFSETGQSYNRIEDISPSGACSGCHIPHKSLDYRMWPRSLAEERGKLKADGTSQPNYLGNPTLNCYDCHEHDSSANSLDNDPAKINFNADHRPQNIAFGIEDDDSDPKDQDGNWNSDPPGGTIAGYYENDPPNNYPNIDTTNYGVYSGAIPEENVGGHFFKYGDPATGSSSFDQYDKLPCRDCHDPHVWDSTSRQGFIKTNLAGNSLSQAIPSTNMSNPLTPGATQRDDDKSRDICTTCHGDADLNQPVRYSDINVDYNNTSLIRRPPSSIAQHKNADTSACTDCHKHNSITASCRRCHGFPPPPPGSAPTPNPPYPNTDSHPLHYGKDNGGATASQYFFDCNVCHTTSAMGSGAEHQNPPGTVDIEFDLTSIGQGTVTGFDMPTDANSSCGPVSGANIYCHGDAKNVKSGAAGALLTIYQNVTWGAANPGCEGCHGTSAAHAQNTYMYGAPDYVNSAAVPGDQNSNSHEIHAGSSIACAECHYDTIKDFDPADAGTWTLDTTSSTHVNGSIDVVIAPGRDNDGDGRNNYIDEDPTYKQCINVSCHGAGTPEWGEDYTGGCFDCHAGGESPAKPQDDYGTPGTPNPVDQSEYIHSGHGRPQDPSGNYPWSDNPAANFFEYNAGNSSHCYYCHSTAASHVDKDPQDPFRLGTWAEDTDGLCLNCHSASPPGPNEATVAIGINNHSQTVFAPDNNYTWPFTPKCVDCHDPHGDGLSGDEQFYMMRSDINYPQNATDTTAGSDNFGRPLRTAPPPDPPLDPLTFNDLIGMADGSYATATTPGDGACEICHNQPPLYNRAGASSAGTHVSRTGRCTTCHLHADGFRGSGGSDIGQYFDDHTSGSNYDAQSKHPIERNTTGTLTFSGEDNCLSCHGAQDKEGGNQWYSNECLKCHFDNQTNAPGTNHQDGILQMADLGSLDINGLPTGELTISNITESNNFCLQCHSGSPPVTLGGQTPSGIYLKDNFNAQSSHMDSNVTGVGNEAGCIYCHHPHGRTNLKLVRENPDDRRGVASPYQPQKFGVFPPEPSYGANQNLSYANDSGISADLPDALDANSYCSSACHLDAKDRYIVRRDDTTPPDDGYYIYSGNKKQHTGGAMGLPKSRRHGHVNYEIISTDAMVADYMSQPGAPGGASYYKYPDPSTSADPATYNPVTASIKFYGDELDGSRDFDQNTDYATQIRYRYVCQTCHDVHGTTFNFDMRLDYTSSSDLCNECHR